MSFANYTETEVLEWLLTSGAVTRPSSWYVGLFTVAPSDTGGGTEVSGGNYAREAVTFTVSGDTASNSANIEFNEATASWGAITYAAVFDASSGGNMLAYAALTTSKAIDSGDILRIPAGDLDITLD
jgi:hypothetical protein